MSKFELRQKIAQILRKAEPHKLQRQSKSIIQQVIYHPKYITAQKISIFLSTEREVDTLTLIRHVLEVDKKRCFIPYVQKLTSDIDEHESRMIMVELDSMSSFFKLEPNHYGIREPRDGYNLNKADPTVTANQLDLIIVPGVAFSVDGRRLGHGKGYYDEFLFKWTRRAGKAPYTIGLSLREQLVENPLAIEGLDYKLDEVITAID